MLRQFVGIYIVLLSLFHMYDDILTRGESSTKVSGLKEFTAGQQKIWIASNATARTEKIPAPNSDYS